MYKGFYLFLLVVVFSQYCTVIVGIAIVVAEYPNLKFGYEKTLEPLRF